MTLKPFDTISVSVKRRWNGVLMLTDHLHPTTSHAAPLDYTIDPWPDEGGVPGVVAIARGLADCGVVAARWFDETPPSGDVHFMPAPSRGAVRRAFESLTETWPASLVATRSPDTIALLLKQGWELQFRLC